ncbi:MAG: cysteine desulfurase [Acidimicrobiales bacterium]|nr:cysteine desulfurase [Acidimicrobiales bacterium]
MHPAALEAMVAEMQRVQGNPTGAHRIARDARRRLDDAREIIGDLTGSDPGGVIFTGGGTEADNLAITGLVGPGAPAEGKLAVCPATEHHAVLHPVQAHGGRVVGVNPDGTVDLDALAQALDAEVAVVSVMVANNESGVIQPLEPVRALMDERAPDAVLHTDAVQGAVWLDLAEAAAPADLLALSAHKFGGPMGVGALIVKHDTKLAPLLLGGGQERERRAGTQNVPGAVAMAAALAAYARDRASENARLAAERDRLADGLLAAVPNTFESGDRAKKVPGSCHLCFDGIESEALLFLLEREGIYASAASSCSSGAQEPSHVLAAMGVSRERAQGSLRLSLGRATTSTDIDRALAIIPPAVAHLREAGS